MAVSFSLKETANFSVFIFVLFSLFLHPSLSQSFSVFFSIPLSPSLPSEKNFRLKTSTVSISTLFRRRTGAAEEPCPAPAPKMSVFFFNLLRLEAVTSGSLQQILVFYLRLPIQGFSSFSHLLCIWFVTGSFTVSDGAFLYFAGTKINPHNLWLLVFTIPGPFTLQVDSYWDNIGTIEWPSKVQTFVWHWIKVFFPVKGNCTVVKVSQLVDLLYRERSTSVSGCGPRQKDVSGDDSRLQTDGIMVQMAFISRRRKDRYEEFSASDAYYVIDRICFHVLDTPHVITWCNICSIFVYDLYCTDQV